MNETKNKDTLFVRDFHAHVISKSNATTKYFEGPVRAQESYWKGNCSWLFNLSNNFQNSTSFLLVKFLIGKFYEFRFRMTQEVNNKMVHKITVASTCSCELRDFRPHQTNYFCESYRGKNFVKLLILYKTL